MSPKTAEDNKKHGKNEIDRREVHIWKALNGL